MLVLNVRPYCTLFACLLFTFCTATAAISEDYPRKITKSTPRAAIPPSQPQANTPHSFSAPSLVIEELTAELYSDNTILLVQGKILNEGYIPAKGYLIVNLLDKHDSVITAYETEINNGSQFGHGKSKPFEAQFDVSNIKNMTNVSIEFITP